MKAQILLVVGLTMGILGCSTKPPAQPAKIDPPPVALVTKCLVPADLPAESTARDLALWAVAWIGAYGCERSKREALIESWPR